MDLATAWKAFRGIVRDAQDALCLLHGHFQESTGRPIHGIVGSESLPNVWEQTRPLDRNDKKELLALLTKLESSLSDQNTSAILKGLQPILPSADKIKSDIGPCLDRLRSVVHGFADDVMRDAADGDLLFRVCPRYLRLREAMDPLTLLEDGYAKSRTLEQALADRTPAKTSVDGNGKRPRTRRPAGRNEKCDDQVIAALCKIHRYENGSVGNFEPATEKVIGEKAGVTKGAVSRVFKRWHFFKSYRGYVTSCRDKTLAHKLKFLNREFAELATYDPSKMNERPEGD